MKRLAHAKKRDHNEKEIIKALEAIGCDVIRLDVFDILVGYRGVNHLIEIKTQKGKPTAAQLRLHAKWRGGPLHFVTTIDEAISVVTEQFVNLEL